MPVFTGQQAKQIKEAIKAIIGQVHIQAKKNEAEDIGEFIASEIIDLVEYMSPEVDMQTAIAKAVLDTEKWPQETYKPVRKHFSLPY